jgi:enoyl-CoA hydratase/carnithine racemase
MDGPATAGGVGFALASDLLWVGPKASFSFPETRLGIVPATVSVVARRRLNAVKLTGMLLSGRVVGPEEALRLGLADFVSAGSAAKEAEAFARKLIEENSDEAMRRTKAFLQSEFETFLGTELENAKREFCEGLATSSARRGIQAFREKRAVRWSEPES